MTKKRVVCIVSHPRSGSTTFMRTAANTCNAVSFYEIFHMHENVVKEHIELAIGKDGLESLLKSVECDYGLGLQEFYRKYPAKYIDMLCELTDSENVIFKIFPNHLKESMAIKAVLNRSDQVMFLLRNTLHSYISNNIAKKVGTYANLDTSEVLIDYDQQDFISWHNHILRFFNAVKTKLSLLSCSKGGLLYNYESLYCVEHVKRALLDCYKSIGLSELEQNHKNASLKKQDRRSSARDKVSNPESLDRSLKMLSLTSLNNACSPVRHVELITNS